jgi:hypothetical protein
MLAITLGQASIWLAGDCEASFGAAICSPPSLALWLLGNNLCKFLDGQGLINLVDVLADCIGWHLDSKRLLNCHHNVHDVQRIRSLCDQGFHNVYLGGILLENRGDFRAHPVNGLPGGL